MLLDKSEGFHSHVGNFSHADLIGKEKGTRILNSKGHVSLAVKPTKVDFTRQMLRIATVVYPKDLGAIITSGDVYEGFDEVPILIVSFCIFLSLGSCFKCF